VDTLDGLPLGVQMTPAAQARPPNKTVACEPTAPTMSDPRRVFDDFDTDRDGFLDRREVGSTNTAST
jgi:hypothetical protein